MKENVIVYWFRNDLRLNDNHGLYQAFKMNLPVLPVFIFDRDILKAFPSPTDQRMAFIYEQVKVLKEELETYGSSLKSFYASPLEVFEQLIKEYSIIGVVCNKEYEPYDRKLDDKVEKLFVERDILYYRFKDRVIFEENEVLNNYGKPYTVYTPYNKKWKSLLNQFPITNYPSENFKEHFVKSAPFEFPSFEELRFVSKPVSFPLKEIPEDIIEKYALYRDFPAVQGTTRLGVHIRYGTISIRELVVKAQELSEVFLNELIWREFFYCILWNYPEVVQRSFKPAYDHIIWRNSEEEFRRWCNGETGYPIVDAGMRELLETGFMHNRVRMITAGFLTRHLLIDWRWGEAWFAEKLLDYDLALNNGNWQWAAGTGCDGAPWFRIFNPFSQQIKYDPNLEYVKKWVPELETESYPGPVVEHQYARQRALDVYKAALRQY